MAITPGHVGRNLQCLLQQASPVHNNGCRWKGEGHTSGIYDVICAIWQQADICRLQHRDSYKTFANMAQQSQEIWEKAFEVLVAVTDTDLKEHAALLMVFPHLWLLICKFHIHQSWHNHHNKILKGTSPALMQMKDRMRRLETELIQSTEFGAAQTLMLKECEVLVAACEGSRTSLGADCALVHVDYLC